MTKKAKAKTSKQIIPKGIVDPMYGSTPLASFFRVSDSEKLELALATCRVMADAGLDINIYGPHRFVNEIFDLPRFPKIIDGQGYVSFHPGTDGRSENGEVVLNFEEFGLVPLRDVDLAYYDVWNGKIPDPVGRIEISYLPPEPTVHSAFDDFRIYESLVEIYPSNLIPVEFSWYCQTSKEVKKALGVLNIHRDRMTRNVPFSHVSFRGAEYRLFLRDASLPDDLPYGDMIELNLNPNMIEVPRSGNTNAVPLSRGRINRDTNDGSYHYGWMCRSCEDSVFRLDADENKPIGTVVDAKNAHAFLCAMLAIPETADRIVLHLPAGPAGEPF